MGIQDLIVTPFYLILFTVLAYFIRPYVTNKQTRKYFLPALWVRFVGAIWLGLVYQFYYAGGDTFNYWEHGSRWIYAAFQEDISLGIKLLLTEGGGRVLNETYPYSSKIWYFRDHASYSVVRIVALCDLFTFHTYSASALFFALFSFSGSWAMFTAIQKKYPNSSRGLAFAILFFPSVVFWGSGILKDTITLGALGWLAWSLLCVLEFKKYRAQAAFVFIYSIFIIYSIKLYILICFFPMIAVWLFLKNIGLIKNLALKVLIIPALLSIFGISGLFALVKITEDDKKYQLDNLAEQAAITAYDIRYGWGSRTGGDGGYDIGLPDGTWQSMIKLMPQAINVSIFRPYLWEVKNPLMLLSSLESLVVLVLTLRLIFVKGITNIYKDPFLIFCVGFSLLFAFAVGISTFNFGTLMRYKIPFMPFFMVALLVKFKTPLKKE